VDAQCGWKISSRIFQKIYRLHLLACESVHGEALSSYETLVSLCPTTRRKNRQDLLPQYGSSFATIYHWNGNFGEQTTLPSQSACLSHT